MDMPAFIDLVAEFRHIDEIGFKVRFTAHTERVDALPIDRIFNLMFVFQAARDAEVCSEHSNCEDIVAVEG